MEHNGYQIAIEVTDTEGPAALIVLAVQSDGTVLDKHQADRVDSDALASAFLLCAYASCTDHKTRVQILRVADRINKQLHDRPAPLNNDLPF